jgi:hypothetical protein
MLLFRLAVLVISLTVATAVSAQSFEAYVTGGAGGFVHSTGGSGPLMAGAGGAEWLTTQRLGLAADAGLLIGPHGDLAVTLGLDARLRLRGRTPADGWAPHVFVGYSPLRFFDLSDQGLQFGAGLDYRLSPGRALRFEFRDIMRDGGSVSSHYWTVRVGMTFRPS